MYKYPIYIYISNIHTETNVETDEGNDQNEKMKCDTKQTMKLEWL